MLGRLLAKVMVIERMRQHQIDMLKNNFFGKKQEVVCMLQIPLLF